MLGSGLSLDLAGVNDAIACTLSGSQANEELFKRVQQRFGSTRIYFPDFKINTQFKDGLILALKPKIGNLTDLKEETFLDLSSLKSFAELQAIFLKNFQQASIQIGATTQTLKEFTEGPEVKAAVGSCVLERYAQSAVERFLQALDADPQAQQGLTATVENSGFILEVGVESGSLLKSSSPFAPAAAFVPSLPSPPASASTTRSSLFGACPTSGTPPAVDYSKLQGDLIRLFQELETPPQRGIYPWTSLTGVPAKQETEAKIRRAFEPLTENWLTVVSRQTAEDVWRKTRFPITPTVNGSAAIRTYALYPMLWENYHGVIAEALTQNRLRMEKLGFSKNATPKPADVLQEFVKVRNYLLNPQGVPPSLLEGIPIPENAYLKKALFGSLLASTGISAEHLPILWASLWDQGIVDLSGLNTRFPETMLLQQMRQNYDALKPLIVDFEKSWEQLIQRDNDGNISNQTDLILRVNALLRLIPEHILRRGVDQPNCKLPPLPLLANALYPKSFFSLFPVERTHPLDFALADGFKNWTPPSWLSRVAITGVVSLFFALAVAGSGGTGGTVLLLGGIGVGAYNANEALNTAVRAQALYSAGLNADVKAAKRQADAAFVQLLGTILVGGALRGVKLDYPTWLAQVGAGARIGAVSALAVSGSATLVSTDWEVPPEVKANPNGYVSWIRGKAIEVGEKLVVDALGGGIGGALGVAVARGMAPRPGSPNDLILAEEMALGIAAGRKPQIGSQYLVLIGSRGQDGKLYYTHTRGTFGGYGLAVDAQSGRQIPFAVVEVGDKRYAIPMSGVDYTPVPAEAIDATTGEIQVQPSFAASAAPQQAFASSKTSLLLPPVDLPPGAALPAIAPNPLPLPPQPAQASMPPAEPAAQTSVQMTPPPAAPSRDPFRDAGLYVPRFVSAPPSPGEVPDAQRANGGYRGRFGNSPVAGGPRYARPVDGSGTPPPANPLVRSKTVPFISTLPGVPNTAEVTVSIRSTDKQKIADPANIPNNVSREVTIQLGERDFYTFRITGRTESKPRRWVFDVRDVNYTESGRTYPFGFEILPSGKNSIPEMLQLNIGKSLIQVPFSLLYDLGQFKEKLRGDPKPPPSIEQINHVQTGTFQGVTVTVPGMRPPGQILPQQARLKSALKKVLQDTELVPASAEAREGTITPLLGWIEAHFGLPIMGSGNPTVSLPGASVPIRLERGNDIVFARDQQTKIPLANGDQILIETFRFDDPLFRRSICLRMVGYHKAQTNTLDYPFILDSFVYNWADQQYSPVKGISKGAEAFEIPIGMGKFTFNMDLLRAYDTLAQAGRPLTMAEIVDAFRRGRQEDVKPPTPTTPSTVEPPAVQASPPVSTPEPSKGIGGGGFGDDPSRRTAALQRGQVPTAPSAGSRALSNREELLQRTGIPSSLVLWDSDQPLPYGFRMDAEEFSLRKGSKTHQFSLGSLLLNTEKDLKTSQFTRLATLAYVDPKSKKRISMIIYPTKLPNGDWVFAGTEQLKGIAIYLPQSGEARLMTHPDLEQAIARSLGMPSATDGLSTAAALSSPDSKTLLDFLAQNGLKVSDEMILPTRYRALMREANVNLSDPYRGSKVFIDHLGNRGQYKPLYKFLEAILIDLPPSLRGPDCAGAILDAAIQNYYRDTSLGMESSVQQTPLGKTLSADARKDLAAIAPNLDAKIQNAKGAQGFSKMLGSKLIPLREAISLRAEEGSSGALRQAMASAVQGMVNTVTSGSVPPFTKFWERAIRLGKTAVQKEEFGDSRGSEASVISLNKAPQFSRYGNVLFESTNRGDLGGPLVLQNRMKQGNAFDIARTITPSDAVTQQIIRDQLPTGKGNLKLYPRKVQLPGMDQPLLIGYVVQNPDERSALVIHPSSSRALQPVCEKLYQRLSDLSHPMKPEEVIQDLATLHYLLVQQMHYRNEGENALLAQAGIFALATARGIQVGRVQPGVELSLEALALSLEEFVKKYASFFE